MSLTDLISASVEGEFLVEGSSQALGDDADQEVAKTIAYIRVEPSRPHVSTVMSLLV